MFYSEYFIIAKMLVILGRSEFVQSELPKCPICGSTEGFESSGILSKYAQCCTCMSKWELSYENKKLSGLILHELPKDGSCVYTITNTNTPLFDVLGEWLAIDFWKNLELERKINWELLAENVSSDVLKALVTTKNEKILYQWAGIRIVCEEKIKNGNTVEKTRKESGVLLLTTQRLCWLAQRVHGFWKQASSFLLTYETPLEKIRSMSGDTGDSANWGSLSRISIVDSRGENAFGLNYAFFELFKPIVENAIETRTKEIDAEKKKQRLHIMLDFSFLKTFMEKGGLVIQVLKCPECGASIEFPKSGIQAKCPYCNKTIYAQDIFEKVKSLLE